MNYGIELTTNAKADLVFWQKNDKRVLKRILSLFADMQQTPYSGLGKPEALRHQLSGSYSRRIDKQNRIVYEVDESTHTIYVKQLRFHY